MGSSFVAELTMAIIRLSRQYAAHFFSESKDEFHRIHLIPRGTLIGHRESPVGLAGGLSRWYCPRVRAGVRRRYVFLLSSIQPEYSYRQRPPARVDFRRVRPPHLISFQISSLLASSSGVSKRLRYESDLADGGLLNRLDSGQDRTALHVLPSLAGCWRNGARSDGHYNAKTCLPDGSTDIISACYAAFEMRVRLDTLRGIRERSLEAGESILG